MIFIGFFHFWIFSLYFLGFTWKSLSFLTYNLLYFMCITYQLTNCPLWPLSFSLLFSSSSVSVFPIFIILLSIFPSLEFCINFLYSPSLSLASIVFLHSLLSSSFSTKFSQISLSSFFFHLFVVLSLFESWTPKIKITKIAPICCWNNSIEESFLVGVT